MGRELVASRFSRTFQSKSSFLGKSDSKSCSVKRSFPQWMSSKTNGNESNREKNEESKENRMKGRKSAGTSSSSTTNNFSKLLEGVVFVLSGFVNPECATLRSQALEMGAEYRPDWSWDCTRLVCGYSNAPKFRQFEADCGTIVKKDWMLECYSQKDLVEIDNYFMHAGKPRRKNNNSNESGIDQKVSPPRKSENQVERGPHSRRSAFSSSKVLQSRASNPAKECFSPSKLKGWATDDLNRTISWLEGQEEKPEPSEIKQIAAEGILICLQDAIDFLEHNQDFQQVTEQWNVVPHAVEELAKLVDAGNGAASLSKEDLCRQAKACKQVYEAELSSLDNSKTQTKRLKTDESGKGNNGTTNAMTHNTEGYDSVDQLR